MTPRRICLIHTAPLMVQLFTPLCRDRLPDVMVTCSSIGPAVDLIQSRFQRPVLRIDQPMAERAVAQGRKIGIAATLRTALESTSELLLRKAEGAGKNVERVECLCEGAFEAVMAGDQQTHDAIVSKAMTNELGDVDLIVLAQASMAGVVDRLPPEALTAPVLSSPDPAMDYIRERLARLRPN